MMGRSPQVFWKRFQVSPISRAFRRYDIEMTSRWRVCGQALLLWVICLSSLHAERYSFRHYGPAEGLTNVVVYSLLQDREGFLWAGTPNGLFRFDGCEFRRFDLAPTGGSSAARALVEIGGRQMLVGTSEGVLRRTGSGFKPVLLGRKVHLETTANLMPESGDSALLAVEQGLARITADGRVTWLSQQPAQATVTDEAGRTWVASENHLCRLQGNTLVPVEADLGLPRESWLALATDSEGGLLIANRHHLYWRKAGRSRVEGPEPVTGIWSLSHQNAHSLRIPTSMGLVTFDAGGWRTIGVHSGLLTDAVLATLRDREGSFWLGLGGGGLARWRGEDQWASWTAQDGLPGGVVWSVGRDHAGRLWVSTNKGVAVIKEGKVMRVLLPEVATEGLEIAPDGSAWVLTETRGVIHFRSDNQWEEYGLPNRSYSNADRAIFLDRNDNLWVSGRGLARARLKSQPVRFEPISLPEGQGGFCRQIFEDRKGHLWAPCSTGLYVGDGSHWQRLSTADGLKRDSVAAVAESPEGDLWIAYMEWGGLARLRHQENGSWQVTDLPASRGPQPQRIFFLKFGQDGSLWAGTDCGLDVLRSGQWQHYDSNDGLIWNDCDRDGFREEPDRTIWISTSGGLSRFRPRRFCAISLLLSRSAVFNWMTV
jgi:ligand-binding sensor domain-containing protein